MSVNVLTCPFMKLDFETIVEKGDLEHVKGFFETTNLHWQINDGLRLACRLGHFEIVQYLVEKGASIQALEGKALENAVQSGRLDILQYLLSKGGQLPEDPYLKERIIDIATTQKHMHMIQFFKEQKMDDEININHNALNRACLNGDLKMVKQLVQDEGAIIVNGDFIESACISENIDLVKYLFENGAKAKETDFLQTIRDNRLDILKCFEEYLTKEEFSEMIAYDNYRPMRVACWRGNVDIVKYLFHHGSDVFYDNGRSLCNAIQAGNVEVVKFLIQNEKRLMNHIYEPEIYRIIENNDFEILKFLLRCGLHLENLELYFKHACLWDHFDIFYLLLQQNQHLIIHLSPQQKKQVEFFKKMELKKQTKAVNIIGTWWIPICYDLNRDCGQRMMERSWQRVEEMYKK